MLTGKRALKKAVVEQLSDDTNPASESLPEDKFSYLTPANNDESTRVGFLCKFCCEIFDLPEFLDDHLRIKHNKSRTSNIKQIISDAAAREVKFSGKNASDYGVRIKSASSSSSTEACWTTCNSSNGRRRRGQNGCFPCPHCDFVSKRRYNLNAHVASIHEGRRYQCAYCETTFSMESNLIRHRKFHRFDDGNNAEASCSDRPRKGRKRHLLTEQHNNNNDSNDKLKVDHDDDHDQQPSSSSSSSKKRRV